MDLRFQHFEGAAIEEIFAPLAQLRIAVFHDFPYLYEGSLPYEMEYLKTYANSPRALVFAVFDAEHLVGASTCIPLMDETAETRAPFERSGYAIEDWFYFGESLLLPSYRGHGLGHRFFEVRENHAVRWSEYKHCCYCAVERPTNHPLKPAGYRPLDTFWQKRGYSKATELQTEFAWPDLGEEHSSLKTMTFWTRDLLT